MSHGTLRGLDALYLAEHHRVPINVSDARGFADRISLARARALPVDQVYVIEHEVVGLAAVGALDGLEGGRWGVADRGITDPEEAREYNAARDAALKHKALRALEAEGVASVANATEALVATIRRLSEGDLQNAHSALYRHAETLEPLARNALLALRDRINELADQLREPL